jgi:hypothetical protein
MTEKIPISQFLTQIGADENVDLRDFFYDGEYLDYENDIYKFEASLSQRGDGSGHETFYVFKRLADNKCFYYYIYDGMIEYDYLQPTEQKVTVVWDFERQY